MTVHSIRETNGGRFEVDYGWGGRKQTFDTRLEAEIEMADSIRRQDADAAEYARNQAARDRFSAQHPELTARQLKWQQWRSEEYDQRVRCARNTAREAMRHASDRNAGKTARYANEAREAMEYYETDITAADSAAKTAIRNGDAAAWEAALVRCEAIMGGGR